MICMKMSRLIVLCSITPGVWEHRVTKFGIQYECCLKYEESFYLMCVVICLTHQRSFLFPDCQIVAFDNIRFGALCI